MKTMLLNLAYAGEVFFSRCQGIAFDSPKWNGEYLLVRRLRQHIKTAIDGGANVGDWSAYVLSQTASRPRLILVEPHPENMQLLQQRFAGLEHVEFRQAALGATVGVVQFAAAASAGCGSGHVLSGGDEPVLEVQSVTLADIHAPLGNTDIDLIKLDIEGEEMAALRGGEGLFRTARIGALQLEYNGTWLRTRTQLKDLFEFAGDFGYGLLQATPFGFTTLRTYGEGLEDYRMRNLVLARPDFIAHLAPLSATGRARVEQIAAGN